MTPGIILIFEISEHQGQHYVSVGFVDGGGLAQEIAYGPLQSLVAKELVKKIRDSIADANEDGVIHRVLKPTNTLLGRDRLPKVTDFGLAEKLESDPQLTGTGQISGMPSYIPPE